MQDDKVVEGKVRLARILGERMEKAFYPAARRSFTSETDVGTAFYAWAKAHELSFAENRHVLNDVIRKYVCFRLQLASKMARDLSAESHFLSSAFEGHLDFDTTRSLMSEFDAAEKAASLFKGPDFFTKSAVLEMLSLMTAEVKESLLPAADFFAPETEGFVHEARRILDLYIESLSFCDPDFRGREGKLPLLLLKAIGTDLGLSQRNRIMESAKTMVPLDEMFSKMQKTEEGLPDTRFIYRYMLFRAYVPAFFASYLWQRRDMRDSIAEGILQSPSVARWVRRRVAAGDLLPEDIPVRQKMYLKIHMFMRQWAFFNPKNTRAYYRYFPDFAMRIADKASGDAFPAAAMKLMRELGKTREGNKRPFSKEIENFLIEETGDYVIQTAHTIYFTYGLSFRKPDDFVVSTLKELPIKHPFLAGIKKIFGL